MSLKRKYKLSRSRPTPSAEQVADPLSIAGAVWDAHADQVGDQPPELVHRAEWQAHPLVRAHWTSRAGSPLIDWLTSRMPSDARLVSIGCGTADGERELLGRGAVSEALLFDVSGRCLEIAASNLETDGLRDRAQLMNRPLVAADLDAGVDAVLFNSSLHHVEDLEGVLSNVIKALRPGGVLLANEYVGPNRFRFPEDDVRYARDVYNIINGAVRRSLPELPLPDPEAVAAFDPTEAVRSEEIVPALEQRFREIEHVRIGGAFLYPLWNGLDHDALHETQLGLDSVGWLLAYDELLLESGRLPSYFDYFCCRAPR